MRAFSFSRVVLALVVGAPMSLYLQAALQTGPDLTDSNTCKIVRRFHLADPGQCGPWIDSVAMTIVAIIFVLCIATIVWEFCAWRKWKAKMGPSLFVGGIALAILGGVIWFFERRPSEAGAQTSPIPQLLPQSPALPPDLSPEQRELVERRTAIAPIQMKYHSAYPNGDMKSANAIAFYNIELQNAGLPWRVTPENIKSLFGVLVIGGKFNSNVGSTGIRIQGSSGNAFDQTEINTSGIGIDLKNADKNKFRDTKINPPPANKKDQ